MSDVYLLDYKKEPKIKTITIKDQTRKRTS